MDIQPLNRSAARVVLAYWLRHHNAPQGFRHLFWYSEYYESFWPSSSLVNLAK